jgi:hypothetical protein
MLIGPHSKAQLTVTGPKPQSRSDRTLSTAQYTLRLFSRRVDYCEQTVCQQSTAAVLSEFDLSRPQASLPRAGGPSSAPAPPQQPVPRVRLAAQHLSCQATMPCKIACDGRQLCTMPHVRPVQPGDALHQCCGRCDTFDSLGCCAQAQRNGCDALQCGRHTAAEYPRPRPAQTSKLDPPQRLQRSIWTTRPEHRQLRAATH